MGRHRDFWRSALPPRKKDWTEGSTQIGVFYRGPAGEVIEFTINKSTVAQQRAIAAFFRALPNVEEALIKVREETSHAFEEVEAEDRARQDDASREGNASHCRCTEGDR